MTVRTVAFIGLGVMSRGMCAVAAGAGFDVVAWNRSPRDPIEGVSFTDTAASAVENAEVVIVSVTDDAALEQVLCEEPGLARLVRPGTVVVDTTTTSPRTAVRMARVLEDHGADFVDAPVSGGAEGAANGTLTFFCGGDEAAVLRAQSVLGTLGAQVVRMGGHGAGQTAKLVNQVVLAGALLGVAEGMAIAKAAHLDLDALISAVTNGAAGSWMFEHRAPFMARDEYPPAGRVALHLKDLRIAAEETAALGLRLEGMEHVLRLEDRLVSGGRGDLDVSAIHLLVSRGADTTSIDTMDGPNLV